MVWSFIKHINRKRYNFTWNSKTKQVIIMEKKEKRWRKCKFQRQVLESEENGDKFKNKSWYLCQWYPMRAVTSTLKWMKNRGWGNVLKGSTYAPDLKLRKWGENTLIIKQRWHIYHRVRPSLWHVHWEMLKRVRKKEDMYFLIVLSWVRPFRFFFGKYDTHYYR